jgi:hypothetical protein
MRKIKDVMPKKHEQKKERERKREKYSPYFSENPKRRET